MGSIFVSVGVGITALLVDRLLLWSLRGGGACGTQQHEGMQG